MISPNTKPGTKIICINTNLKSGCSLPSFFYFNHLDGLTKGKIYTVSRIEQCFVAKTGYNVVIKEIQRLYDFGYDLSRFDYLVEKNLPEEITRCLVVDDKTKELLEA